MHALSRGISIVLVVENQCGADYPRCRHEPLRGPNSGLMGDMGMFCNLVVDDITPHNTDM